MSDPKSGNAIWRPNVTVAAVVERDGKFLVVEEQADDGLVINQPAGHLDAGESLVHAMVRETLEETAWDVEPLGVIAVYRWINASGTTYMRFAFAARAVQEYPGRPLDDGIARALWLAPEEIDGVKHVARSPMVLRTIADYRRGRLLPLDLLQDLG